MPLIEDAIEICPKSSNSELDGYAEGSEQCAGGNETHVVHPAVLDLRNDRSSDPGSRGQVELPPTSTLA